MGSALGGFFGSQAEQQTSSLENRDLRNFAPFQLPAITSIFDLLGGTQGQSLLQGSTQANNLLSDALSANANILGRFAQRPADQDLRGLFDVARDVSGLAGQFNPAIDLFEEIFDEEGERFRNLSNRSLQELDRNAAERGVGFLLPFARGDFLDRGNPFADRIVQSALDDALARTAATFEGAGRLRSGVAPRTVAREAGRISGAIRAPIFEAERGRQIGAARGILEGELNEGIRRLNAIGQAGNLSTAGTNARIAAAQGVLAGRTAEAAERSRRLGLAGGIGGQLQGLQQFGIGSAAPLAQVATELPFIPITNFANVAFSPLGQTGTINRQSTTTGTSGSPFRSLLGAGLTAASFAGKPGSTTSAATGVPGFGPFGPNLGPLAGGSFSSPFLL